MVWMLLMQMYSEGNVKYEISIGCISEKAQKVKRTTKKYVFYIKLKYKCIWTLPYVFTSKLDQLSMGVH